MRHKRTTELRYPNLWRNCVGAWAPCLGPTGLTLRDWSGFGNHGTLSGMSAITAWSPQQRYSLLFDGTDDSVTLNNDAPLRITGSLTLSCWVKTLAARYQYLIVKWGQAAGTDAYHLRLDNDGKVYFTTSTNGSYQPARDVIGTTDVRGTNWAHVAAVYNGVTSTVYVNGVQQNSTATTGTLYDGTLAVQIGGLSDGTFRGNWLQGYLDDARIYNRALSGIELRLLASRRGIAYELAPRRRASSAVAFNRRRRLLVGASS